LPILAEVVIVIIHSNTLNTSNGKLVLRANKNDLFNCRHKKEKNFSEWNAKKVQCLSEMQQPLQLVRS